MVHKKEEREREQVKESTSGILFRWSILQLWLILPLDMSVISAWCRSINLKSGVNLEVGEIKTEMWVGMLGLEIILRKLAGW